MKINISCPSTGQQKVLEIDDEKRLHNLYDRRMAQEVDGSVIGDEYAGYIFKISGGNDKQGFPMKQGVLSTSRVRLLLSKGHSCYRPRRTGERKRKSVRGCIVSHDLSVLNLVVVKIGDKDVPGLTDDPVPRRLGPKRASNIRKLFNLSKEDDVTQYVISRTFTNKKGIEMTKSPKIQRLVTPRVLQRKYTRQKKKQEQRKKVREEAAAYRKLLAQRAAEKRAARRSLLSKRRSSRKSKLAAEAAAAEKK